MTALEKAARAACKADGGDWDNYSEHSEMQDALRREYLDQARAVLMAVRDDEEGVNRAWLECAADYDTGPEETFTAIIDAILRDHPLKGSGE